MTATPMPLVLRRAEAHEFEQVVAVCAEALQWDAARPNRDFFRWKHEENAFGRSPLWVAETEDHQIVGVRTMMRWRFVSGSRHLEMVRAVDTATLPAVQGQGIFSKLTKLAVADLTAEGIDAVFNTPNDKSRPGYLKMGWHEVGKLTISMRPSSLRGVRELRGANAAADKWGESCSLGMAPSDAFVDDDQVARALKATAPSERITTAWTPETLRWRFGLSALNYRVFPLGRGVGDGFVVFRVRQRGVLRELDINEVVSASHVRPGRAISHLARTTHADLVLSTPDVAGIARGLIPVRKLGPRLTWRPLAAPTVPNVRDLALSMATVELF